MVQRSAEAAKIQQSFRSAVERNAHPIEQINNSRCGVAHGFYRRLVGKKVSAINRVVEVLPGRVALALQVLGSINSALRANRMRPFHWHDRKKIYLPAHLGNLDDCRKAREPAANNNNFRISCHF